MLKVKKWFHSGIAFLTSFFAPSDHDDTDMGITPHCIPGQLFKRHMEVIIRGARLNL